MLLRALIVCLLASPAVAQTAPAPPAGAPVNCTDVQVGTAQGYDCLNAQLGSVARGTQRFSSDLNAPVSAASPGYVTGTYNQAATRERLGQNFGKSVTPYRPPAVNYPPPLPRPRR